MRPEITVESLKQLKADVDAEYQPRGRFKASSRAGKAMALVHRKAGGKSGTRALGTVTLPAITTVKYEGGTTWGEDSTGNPVMMVSLTSPVYHQTPLAPGQGFEMSDGRVYVAGPDGCLRRAGRVRETKKQRRARRAAVAKECARLEQAMPALRAAADERAAAFTEEDRQRAKESYEYARERGQRP